jgi:protein-tyrosine kinase
MRDSRPAKSHILRLCSNVENKHSHLIERAAARLAEAQGKSPQADPAARFAEGQAKSLQANLVLDVPSRIDQEASVAQPSARREMDRSQASGKEHGPQVEAVALRKAGLIDQSGSRVADELRIVQNRILRQSFPETGARAVGSANLVMITSAVKGEGKSFVSLNLAGETARHGDRRVLLVDTDAKPNGLSRKLGLSSAPGLVDLARDTGLEIDDVIVPTEAGGLDVLPFGRTGERTGEIFATRRMRDVITTLGRRYADGLIILDAPPCLSSSAPHSLAPVCGQIVLVVAAASTQQTDIEAALELLEDCPEISLLLNKVAPWMSHSSGYYSYLAAEAS